MPVPFITGRKRQYKRSLSGPERKRMRPGYNRKSYVSRHVNDPSGRDLVCIKRKWWVSNWTPNTSTTDGFWRNFTFSMSNVPNNSEFSSLFDFYRIKGWLIELVPRYDGFQGNDTVDTTTPGITNQASCRVHTSVDPKNTIGPTGTYTTGTLNTFLESAPYPKIHDGNKVIRMYVPRPNCTDTIGGTTGRRTACPWILTSAFNVGFWGAQAFITDVNLTGFFGQSYDIYYTVYIELKGVQ